MTNKRPLSRWRIVVFCLGSAFLLLPFQNCSPSHSIGSATNYSVEGGGGGAVVESRGKTLYSQNCASCHGAIQGSNKQSRSAALISLAIQEVSQMNHLRSALSSSDIEAIATALGASPPNNPASEVFACTAGQMAPTPMVKLTNREYRAALNALLDDFSTNLKNDAALVAALNILPSDIVTADRNTRKEQPFFMNANLASSLFETAYQAGGLLVSATTGLQNYANTSQCLAASTITQACHSNFVRELGRRAFRRPLTTAEATSLSTALWDSSLSKAQLLQSTFAGVVSMPDFLYKVMDRGTTSNLGSNILTLTSHEIASKVAFFLTGAPPDATLRGLADSGQLSDAAVLSAQIDRLMATTAAQASIRRFFREAYGYDVYDSFNYSAQFLAGQSLTGVQAAMTQELDDFFSDEVLQRRSTFYQLFTSTSTRMTNANLASIYGVSTGTTNLPIERAGFLSRAAMLSKRSGNYASPIKRGLDIFEHTLCQEVGPPPPSAPTSLPDVAGQILSTRERTSRTTEVAGTSCAVCHGRFNPLGYAFDRFDPLGRLRNNESIFDSSGNLQTTVAINSQSTSSEITSGPVTMRDSIDFGTQLGQSPRAMMCFAKHLKRFESRTLASTEDGCLMNNVLRTMHGSNNNQGSIADAIKSYVMSDEFRRWRF